MIGSCRSFLRRDDSVISEHQGLSLVFRLGGKITARDKQRQLDLLDDDDDDR